MQIYGIDLLKYFKPYRATIGLSTSSLDFKSDDERICVGSSPNIRSSQCSNGGFQSYQGEAQIDPWVEFSPNYFGNTHFGWSSFLGYEGVSTQLRNFPNSGENAEIDFRKISFNPFIYYNWGKRYLHSGGIVLRFGLGTSFQYLLESSIRNTITSEEIDESGKFKIGFSAFLEFNWNWFILRFSHAQARLKGLKSKNLSIESNKVSILYAYYF